MVKVVRARDAEILAQARQVSSAGRADLTQLLELQRMEMEQEQLKISRIRSMKIPIDGEVLLTIRAVLREAVSYHVHRDRMNAALHEEGVRYSPLTSSLVDARGLLQKILDVEAFRGLRIGRPVPVPTPKEIPPQPEGSSGGGLLTAGGKLGSSEPPKENKESEP